MNRRLFRAFPEVVNPNTQWKQLQEYGAIRLGFSTAVFFIEARVPIRPRRDWHLYPTDERYYLYQHESKIVIGHVRWPQVP